MTIWAAGSPETLIPIYPTTPRHIPEKNNMVNMRSILAFKDKLFKLTSELYMVISYTFELQVTLTTPSNNLSQPSNSTRLSQSAFNILKFTVRRIHITEVDHIVTEYYYLLGNALLSTLL
jgi:hypothetical protein